jgi:predicted nucleotidyltransferase
LALDTSRDESVAAARGMSIRPNCGAFSSEEEALAQVVARLVRRLDPEEVWLFGSRAEGRHAPDSDFDLLVVTKPDSGDAGFDYDAAYAPIKGLGVGCDVVPCRADEFNLARSDPTSLGWHVLRTGKKLYERAAPDLRVLHSG